MSAGSLFNILFAFLIFIPVFVFGKHLPVIESVVLSAKMILEITTGTAIFFFNLFSGSGSTQVLIGPIGIASLAGQAAIKGFISLMFFSGLLSMSLGIINLLPLPGLDGGQLSMLFIEAIRRKPLSLRIYHIVTVLGMSLFIILTVLVTYKDIIRLLV